MFPAPGELMFLNIAFLVVGPVFTYLALSRTSRGDERIMCAAYIAVFAILFPIVYAYDVNLRPNTTLMALCFFGSSALTAAIIWATRLLRRLATPCT